MKIMNQNIKNILSGVTGGVAISLLFSAIAAALIVSGTIGESAMWMISTAIHAAASFATGMTVGKLSREKKGLYAVVGSGAYFAVWIVSAFLFWEGIQNHFVQVLIAVVAGALLAWGFLVLPKGNKSHKYSKRFS